MNEATKRAQQVAIDRHRRLHNTAMDLEEARIIDRYLLDITAFLADPASTEVAAMREP